jgi:Na+/H+ antiporter NhaC
MMKMKNKLAIPLLLAFLAFTLLHFSYSLSHSHNDIKAIINLDDDAKVKGQWDNDKKLPVDLPIHFVFILILTAVSVPFVHFPEFFIQRFFFLIPIFHQSNYIIPLPNN